MLYQRQQTDENQLVFSCPLIPRGKVVLYGKRIGLVKNKPGLNKPGCKSFSLSYLYSGSTVFKGKINAMLPRR